MIGYTKNDWLHEVDWLHKNDWLPGAVHQHLPDPPLPGSSGGRVLHFSPGTKFTQKSGFHPFLKTTKKEVWAEFGFPFLHHSIVDRPPPLLLRWVDGFEPAWSNPFNLFSTSASQHCHSVPLSTSFQISNFSFINSTDQAGVSPFQRSELEEGDFEVVRLLPALEDVLEPVLDHLPLRLLHLLHQDV